MPTFGNYDVQEQLGHQVAMHDGIELATNLFIPMRDGEPLRQPVPAVLVRTAYDRTNFTQEARYFASHGYLAITQDVRGTFGSQGEFFAFINEPQDGVSTLDWITRLPECNGKVGMWGCSYMSWVQFAIASQGHPALACMIPFGVAIDTFHHYAYPQGCLQLGMLSWVIFDVWARAARDNPPLREKIESLDFLRFAAQMPWQRGETILAESTQFEDMIFSYTDNDTYNEFWKQPGHGFALYFDKFPDVPMLWVSGWWDGYPRSVCEGYQKMKDLERAQRQYLLLGPWVHNQLSGNVAGDVDFSPHADIDRMDTQRAFFDIHLKGDSREPDVPRARAFIMGGGTGIKTSAGLLHAGGRWWQGQDWPPADMTLTPWYLHGDGSISAQAPVSDERTTRYTHDPSDPVPSIAPPWIFIGYQSRGPHDQLEPTELTGKGVPGRPLAQRPDVCVFQSFPLKQDLTLLGPLEARLSISSSSRDTDFAVKLIDVYPPNEDYPQGYAMTVAEGMLKVRYRDGNDDGDSWVIPGSIYDVRIECFPAGNLFLQGHRLRVDIASTNFPRHAINREGGVTENCIYHSPLHASRIILSVVLNQI